MKTSPLNLYFRRQRLESELCASGDNWSNQARHVVADQDESRRFRVIFNDTTHCRLRFSRHGVHLVENDDFQLLALFRACRVVAKGDFGESLDLNREFSVFSKFSANFLTFSRTTEIPRSSEAFRSSTRSLKTQELTKIPEIPKISPKHAFREELSAECKRGGRFSGSGRSVEEKMW